MKKYIYTFIVLIVCYVVIPLPVKAQCNCSDGSPATALTYTYSLSPTTATNTPVTFPKFDPSIGTLSCITFYDTVTIAATTGARNTDPLTYHRPRIRLSLFPSITDPNSNTFVDEYLDVIYGPDSLAAYETPGDSITYGPDTVYDHVFHENSLTPNGSYMGTGNVTFTYALTGGAIPISDGTNYNISVKTRTWGEFRLIYYWCPALVLSTSIKNFAVTTGAGNSYTISWLVQNELSGSTYEIQVSADGKNYSSVGQVSSTGGTAVPYNYIYNMEQTVAGKVYFRIKQTDAAGNVSYSLIRVISAEEINALQFDVYPNPVKNKLSLQFNSFLNGSYQVAIVNPMGQAVYQRTLNVSNQSVLQLDIPTLPATGMYYVRTKELKTNRTFVNKLFVQP